MKYYVGLGSNVCSRQGFLQKALELLDLLDSRGRVKQSNLYESMALVPEDVKEDWHKPFLNQVVELETSKEPLELLGELQNIEKKIGRTKGPRWSPRNIDLDILYWDRGIFKSPDLNIPHEALLERPFVLAPLRDLVSSLEVGGDSILLKNRRLKKPLPQWMGVANVTPDSFSDGNQIQTPGDFRKLLELWTDHHIHIVDLGAESTRPGARPLGPGEEWERLELFLGVYGDFIQDRLFYPKLSVDTRWAEVASRALDYGAQFINDVSGGTDPSMIEVIQGARCQYILTHSLSIPPSAQIQVSGDPVEVLKKDMETQLDKWIHNGISLDRLIWDPGLGFGKNSWQSLKLLHNISTFLKAPVRILVGHSRKSFMKNWSCEEPGKRDPESVGLSVAMGSKGVDFLRVHNPILHSRVYQGWCHGV